MDEFMKNIVDSYTDAKELEEFAALVGIDGEEYVTRRIFELKCQELFMMIERDVQIPTPPPKDDDDQDLLKPQVSVDRNGYSRDLQSETNCQLTDTSSANLHYNDADRSRIRETSPNPGPSSPKQPRQVGRGVVDVKPYAYQMKGQRTFAKNKAIDTTYQVKFSDEWQGDKLKDLNIQLHQMFDDVLSNVRGTPTDLGRVVIQNNGLKAPIVIPLQKWDTLDSDTVMNGITKVLNSNEELIVDDSMSVTIGAIALPAGSGGGIPITSLYGPGNSLRRKKSMFEIIDSGMCLPIAIGMCYLKSCKKLKKAEWNRLTGTDKKLTEMEKAIKYKTCLESYFGNLKSKTNTKGRRQMAETLCRKAGVPIKDTMGLNDITPFEKLLDVNINVISSKLGNKFIRVVDNTDLPNIFIYLVESDGLQHFHGISSIAGFFGASYFCETCLKPYKRKEHHSCETTCDVCFSKDCNSTSPMSCISCHRQCRSQECFIRHKESQMTKQITLKSQCKTWYQCRTCKKVLKYDDRCPLEHVCGEWKCKICERYYVGQHWCYHRTKTNQTSNKKFIFYDFETRQDEIMECEEGYFSSKRRCRICNDKIEPCSSCRTCVRCRQSWCGLYQHVVNFAVLQSACSSCLDIEMTPESKCDNCGKRCPTCCKKGKGDKYIKSPCGATCGFREQVFSGDDAASQFCAYIMQGQCKDAILVAHNAKAFDLYPILEVLIDRHAIRPDKIIYNGTKIMYMHIAKQMNLTFVDSLNFVPMKLADIPKAFGFEEMSKGYFPHYFNRKMNQVYKGPFPSQTDYGCEYMSSTEYVKFTKWYESTKHRMFDFREEILKYCRNDVDVLRRGMLKFRGIMMEVTDGVDPFDYVTIAGACMGIYKTLFLDEELEVEISDMVEGRQMWCPTKYINGDRCVLINTIWTSSTTLDEKRYTIGMTRFVKSPIAMVPPEGYTKRDNYSKSSIQWLEWVIERNRRNGKYIQLQHALNGGEFRIPGTNYRADGYEEVSKTVYEFHGCVYHGCPCISGSDRGSTTDPITNQSMEELYVVTKKRETHIKSLGYKYVAIWEHEFHQLLKENNEMKQFVSQLDIQDRLNPRDSFFGGRTNAVRLHYKVQSDDEKIQYYDFTSLYPWTNKYCRYPVGHPNIVTDDFEDISNYFGIAKVKVLPPRRLFHPVLPYSSNGKLKFALCRTCSDKELLVPCTCTDEQRAFIGTWCTPELIKAIEKGYRILKTYEVYDFKDSMKYDKVNGGRGLFSSYVNAFLKIKQEASGWPEGCNTEEQKLQYIRLYEENEGIKLEYHKIKKNPGLRSLAKLCLNSFWGKFGQRLGLKQSRFFHESEADSFFQMLSDPRKAVHDFHIVTSEMLQLEWSDDPLFLPIDSKTNVFLASFTTMWARLKLYDVLEELGEDCLYMDTDSVIFVDRNDIHVQNLPIGDYLGELTNEIQSKEGHIVEYVSGGPKNYAFRTLAGNEVCKVRGFTLNLKNSRLINFDVVKDMVLNDGTKKVTVTNPQKISRDSRKRKLYNREENKEYKIVYTKRVVKSDLTTLPYGY